MHNGRAGGPLAAQPSRVGESAPTHRILRGPCNQYSTVGKEETDGQDD